MIARLLAWLGDLLILYLVFRLISGIFFGARRRPGPREAPRSPERLGGTLVRDPQCGTYVPESHAIRATAGASVLYFCSTTCRDTFLAANPIARRASGN